MSQAAMSAQPLLSRRAYRIVLFGLPDAGKSSLLGALAQSAQTQEHLLNAKLIDKSQRLVELQRRLYEDRPRETLEEVAPFPVTLEPLSAKVAAAGGTEAVLFDCDGRVANEILARKDSLTGDLSKRALTQAVLGADTLVLVVDASAEPTLLKRDFGQFTRFLRTLERSRGQRTEIGGLPVYLVLTKCDLLAQPDDNAAAWMDRIEERKRQVHQRFQDFLAEQAKREQMSFGKIDLHVWATAVKRPALADSPARPKEPYGVAELFRQCLDSARVFRARRGLATQQLGWAVATLAVVVAFMVLLVLFLMATQQQTELEQFERAVKAYRPAHDDATVERLREPVAKTIQDLEAFRDNPLFAKLPPEQQQRLNEQLREVAAYDKLNKQWQAYTKAQRLREAPRFAQNDADLDALRTALEKMPLPAQYRTTWDETDFARRQRQWQDEIDIMHTEVNAALKTIEEMRGLDAKIRDRGKYTGEQLDQFEALLRLKELEQPYRRDNMGRVASSRVTYANVAQFDRVAVEIARYEKLRKDQRQGDGK